MRAHTPEEQILYDLRYQAIRDTAHRWESAPDMQRLYNRAGVDPEAAAIATYLNTFYKAVLVEPSGDVPHHILGDTVWGYFREAMRLAPPVLYSKVGTSLVMLYAGSLWQSNWHRPVIAGETVTMRLTPTTEVPGSFLAVSNEAVQEFLHASGGRIVPLEEVPDPYPELVFTTRPPKTVSMEVGTSQSHTITMMGGKPPVVLSVESVQPSGLLARILSGGRLVLGSAAASPGDYTVLVKATDARAVSVTSIVTVTVTPTP